MNIIKITLLLVTISIISPVYARTNNIYSTTTQPEEEIRIQKKEDMEEDLATRPKEEIVDIDQLYNSLNLAAANIQESVKENISHGNSISYAEQLMPIVTNIVNTLHLITHDEETNDIHKANLAQALLMLAQNITGLNETQLNDQKFTSMMAQEIVTKGWNNAVKRR